MQPSLNEAANEAKEKPNHQAADNTESSKPKHTNTIDFSLPRAVSINNLKSIRENQNEEERVLGKRGRRRGRGRGSRRVSSPTYEANE